MRVILFLFLALWTWSITKTVKYAWREQYLHDVPTLPPFDFGVPADETYERCESFTAERLPSPDQMTDIAEAQRIGVGMQKQYRRWLLLAQIQMRALARGNPVGWLPYVGCTSQALASQGRLAMQYRRRWRLAHPGIRAKYAAARDESFAPEVAIDRLFANVSFASRGYYVDGHLPPNIPIALEEADFILALGPRQGHAWWRRYTMWPSTVGVGEEFKNMYNHVHQNLGLPINHDVVLGWAQVLFIYRLYYATDTLIGSGALRNEGPLAAFSLAPLKREFQEH